MLPLLPYFSQDNSISWRWKLWESCEHSTIREVSPEKGNLDCHQQKPANKSIITGLDGEQDEGACYKT